MKCIVANWKNHPAVATEAVALARESDLGGMVLCPPYQFLGMLGSGSLLKHAVLGAQDYTPGMYALGVRRVIIGHSDRRALGDTDDRIAEKMAHAISDSILPILCVGETADEHTRGETETVITEQLRVGLSRIVYPSSEIRHAQSDILNLMPEIWIAYEPVWAISAEPGAEPETASSAAGRIAFLKKKLVHSRYGKEDMGHWKFLYGGSVDSANAHSFLQHHDIDGLLVGAASIHREEIHTIWQLAQHKENK